MGWGVCCGFLVFVACTQWVLVGVFFFVGGCVLFSRGSIAV